MTLARTLSLRTIESITAAMPDLREVKGERGGPARMIATAQNPEAGALRIWQGDKVSRMVYIGLSAELPMRDGSGRSMVLDSHMIFAFTPKHSAVPHFTLDAIAAGPMLAYHLDLLPRVDLAAHLAYMDFVYSGDLDGLRKQALAVPGFSEAPLTPRQYALMSPWMMASRATPEAFQKIPVAGYLDRWLGLAQSGIPADLTSDQSRDDLVRRDAAHRAALFNADVDPVWHQIEAMIGADVGAELREVLRQQDPS